MRSMTTRMPMRPPFELRGPGRVVRRQTTFWDADLQSGMRRVRIHFRGKAEVWSPEDEFEVIRIVTAHPLLEDYGTVHSQLYIATALDQPDELIRTMQAHVQHRSRGWRSAAHYFNEFVGPEPVLRGGHGLLLEGPHALVEELEKIVASFGIRTNTLSSERRTRELQALLLAPSFVVADEFLLEELNSEAG